MEVRSIAEEWMEDYNNKRPHEALGGMTPVKFTKIFEAKGLAPLLQNKKSLYLKKPV
jgi:putative transposase